MAVPNKCFMRSILQRVFDRSQIIRYAYTSYRWTLHVAETLCGSVSASPPRAAAQPLCRGLQAR